MHPRRCGIIVKVELEDDGIWTCRRKIINKEGVISNEAEGKSRLQVETPTVKSKKRRRLKRRRRLKGRKRLKGRRRLKGGRRLKKMLKRRSSNIKHNLEDIELKEYLTEEEVSQLTTGSKSKKRRRLKGRSTHRNLEDDDPSNDTNENLPESSDGKGSHEDSIEKDVNKFKKKLSKFIKSKSSSSKKASRGFIDKKKKRTIPHLNYEHRRSSKGATTKTMLLDNFASLFTPKLCRPFSMKWASFPHSI